MTPTLSRSGSGCIYRTCIPKQIPRFPSAPTRLALASQSTLKLSRYISTRNQHRLVCRASLATTFQVSDHREKQAYIGICCLLTTFTRATLCAGRGSHSIAAPSWLSIWCPCEFYRVHFGFANPAERCQLLLQWLSK